MNNDRELLNAVIAPDETVKWTGRARPFPVIEAYNKKSLLLRWILCIAITVAIIVGYIILALSKVIPFHFVFLILILLIAIYIMVLPWWDAQIIQKKRLYVITDKRVLYIEDDKRFASFPLEKVDKVKLIHKEWNDGDIIFGSHAIQKPYSKIRKITISPTEKLRDPAGVLTGMAFYNISDIHSVKPLLLPGTEIVETKLSDEIERSNHRN